MPEPAAEDDSAAKKAWFHAQRVAARITRSRIDDQKRKKVIPELTSDLRAILNLSPKSWTALVNLHWITKEDALVAAMEKSDLTNAYLSVYAARLLNEKREFKRAFEILKRSRIEIPPDGMVQFEHILETLRTHAGLGDSDGFVKAFQEELELLDDDLQRFHLAFHLDVMPWWQPADWAKKRGLDGDKVSAMLRTLRDKHDDGMSYAAILVSYHSQARQSGKELEALMEAVPRFGRHPKLGKVFRHFFYRYAWRMMVTQRQAGVP